MTIHRNRLILCAITIYFSSASKSDCKSGEPCIFKGKDDGWVVFEEPKTIEGFPHPPSSDSWSKPETSIYLSIASFRDKLCPHTLFNAFTKATHPNRLHVGVVQQNVEEDIDCFDEYCALMKKAGKYEEGQDCPFKDNIRMNRVHASKAKGPTWVCFKTLSFHDASHM
jgi:hypothetical protein